MLGEMSSFFLALRWLSIMTGQTDRLWHFNVAFAAAFFFSRILVLNWAVSVVIQGDRNLFADWEIWQMVSEPACPGPPCQHDVYQA